MNDLQLQRYSRHILLDEIGIEGQQLLLNSHALIIGAGGLGSPVALYLAAAGVGTISIIDDDDVELTNLQRQIMHTTNQIGQSKVSSAASALHAINPDITINAIKQKADSKNLPHLLSTVNVVIDCSDNFATRHIVNKACVALGIPLVSGAVVGFDGQLSVYSPHAAHSPCYACLFPEEQHFEETACSTMGVFAPLVGMVGTIQAAEAIKLMIGTQSSLERQILLIEGRTLKFDLLHTQINMECAVCKKVKAE
ncbi:HesA/MoeB/ThiF family protein [Ampullimonas aquatilis]|uniref:HesA/MoeB/ThiF family protein n=1 Tax=Ampullimonas aquatilis TaxID=1341549 RepID=UPI003C733731